MKTLIITLASILCLLVITNPSTTSFKDHLGKSSLDGLVRESNYFVCSIYVDKTYNEDREIRYNNRYIAIIGNFWVLKVNEKHNAGPEEVNLTKYKKMSVHKFALLIKAKYPEYNNLTDTLLVKKVLGKYPAYKDDVEF